MDSAILGTQGFYHVTHQHSVFCHLYCTHKGFTTWPNNMGFATKTTHRNFTTWNISIAFCHLECTHRGFTTRASTWDLPHTHRGVLPLGAMTWALPQGTHTGVLKHGFHHMGHTVLSPGTYRWVLPFGKTRWALPLGAHTGVLQPEEATSVLPPTEHTGVLPSGTQHINFISYSSNMSFATWGTHTGVLPLGETT